MGIAAAYGMVLAAAEASKSSDHALIERAAAALIETRPTAVNIAWAVKRMMNVYLRSESLSAVYERFLEEAWRIAMEDEDMCKNIGLNMQQFFGDDTKVLTHCNAGALATAAYGTALSGVYVAHESGKKVSVWIDETRPWLQGARLTAWELGKAGIKTTLIVDSAAGLVMSAGKVDCVIVGADRITARGDVANKIGTYSLSVLARHHSIPFFVAAPYSTFDLSLDSGADIKIEERDPSEILMIGEKKISPDGQICYNPVFDVTPYENITAIVTEKGIWAPERPL